MGGAASGRVSATVVYATSSEVVALPVSLAPGSTIEEAVHASGLLALVPSLAPGALDLGIYGKPRPATTTVCNGDRIEVYRPLVVDPKEARRVRAEVKRRRNAPPSAGSAG